MSDHEGDDPEQRMMQDDEAEIPYRSYDTGELVVMIAKSIYPYPQDKHRQETLTHLLMMLAMNIKATARSDIS